jgi:hypothetical protein
VDKALDMMSQVLKDHPNSGKAHYVEAELLARQHRYGEAKAELTTAEKLSPGLPGISPQSVYALKAQLNGGSTTAGTVARDEAPVRASHGFPWGPVLLIGVALFALLAFLRRRNRVEEYQPPMGGGYNPRVPMGRRAAAIRRRATPSPAIRNRVAGLARALWAGWPRARRRAWVSRRAKGWWMACLAAANTDRITKSRAVPTRMTIPAGAIPTWAAAISGSAMIRGIPAAAATTTGNKLFRWIGKNGRADAIGPGKRDIRCAKSR